MAAFGQMYLGIIPVCSTIKVALVITTPERDQITRHLHRICKHRMARIKNVFATPTVKKNRDIVMCATRLSSDGFVDRALRLPLQLFGPVLGKLLGV